MVKKLYPSEYPVVIGIDFGTVYTRATYTIAATEGQCHDITKWPSQPEFSSLVPTVSLYDSSTLKLVSWGSAAKEKIKKNQQHQYYIIEHHKLFLEESYAKETKLPPGLTDVGIISDFLREIHNHIVSELRKGPGRQFEGRYRYCITVPSMWTDIAKNKMREAMILAGLIHKRDHPDRLMLVPETEATAIYCDRMYEGLDLKDNDEMMICDIGGGLMDLVTYHIKLDEEGKRTLQETVEGVGMRLGSKNIDQNLSHYLPQKLSKIPNINHSHEVIEIMKDQFIEQLKIAYDGTEELYLTIPMNDHLIGKTSPTLGLYNDTISFSTEELDQHVYGPIVKTILTLIHQQTKKSNNIKILLLVGSFGSSSYLSSRIMDLLKPLGINIIIPNRQEMAVCRGAVYYGLNPKKVSVRIPRQWYGIDITSTFVEGLDPIEYKVISSDGQVRCDNRFSCFVKRGEPIEVSQCVTKKYSTYFSKITTCAFYAGYTDQEPRYVIQQGVSKAFEFDVITPRLPNIPEGTPIDFYIKIYFGEVEKRVEAIILDKTFDISCRFN
ncbi:hypothetical protein BJ944DRAFT_258163 [Cunninghamella echinulata]|nr:hypothetical protein BJ944DRAFT_258163 [Cunninghamella echinulata]